MDPHATDTNAAKKPLLVLEYQPVQRRRRLTGWDWSLIATVIGFVLVPNLQKATDFGAAKGRVVDWMWLAPMARLLVGVVMRDRSRWWLLYVSLYAAMPWLVDAFAYYAVRHHW